MNKKDFNVSFRYNIIVESYYHESGYSFSKIYFPYNSDKIFDLLFPVFSGIRNYFEDIIETTNNQIQFKKHKKGIKMTKKDFSRIKGLNSILLLAHGYKVINKFQCISRDVSNRIEYGTRIEVERRHRRYMIGGWYLSIIVNDFSELISSFELTCKPRVLNLLKKGYLKIE